MADELEIRPPTPADLPALGRLYEAVKGRPRPESVTAHRLFDTPWGDSVSLIAVDGDVCASMAVYWPVAMRAGDEVVPGAQGMEAVTHPDYRNRPRLFLTLAKQGRDLALERMQLLYTFPNVRSIKLTKHVGATYLGEVGGWGIDLERRRVRLPRLSRRGDEAAGVPTIDELAALAARAHAQPDLVRIDKSADVALVALLRRDLRDLRVGRRAGCGWDVDRCRAARRAGSGAVGRGLCGHLPRPRALRTRRAGRADGASSVGRAGPRCRRTEARRARQGPAARASGRGERASGSKGGTR